MWRSFLWRLLTCSLRTCVWRLNSDFTVDFFHQLLRIDWIITKNSSLTLLLVIRLIISLCSNLWHFEAFPASSVIGESAFFTNTALSTDPFAYGWAVIDFKNEHFAIALQHPAHFHVPSTRSRINLIVSTLFPRLDVWTGWPLLRLDHCTLAFGVNFTQ